MDHWAHPSVQRGDGLLHPHRLCRLLSAGLNDWRFWQFSPPLFWSSWERCSSWRKGVLASAAHVQTRTNTLTHLSERHTECCWWTNQTKIFVERVSSQTKIPCFYLSLSFSHSLCLPRLKFQLFSLPDSPEQQNWYFHSNTQNISNCFSPLSLFFCPHY